MVQNVKEKQIRKNMLWMEKKGYMGYTFTIRHSCKEFSRIFLSSYFICLIVSDC